MLGNARARWERVRYWVREFLGENDVAPAVVEEANRRHAARERRPVAAGAA